MPQPEKIPVIQNYVYYLLYRVVGWPAGSLHCVNAQGAIQDSIPGQTDRMLRPKQSIVDTRKQALWTPTTRFPVIYFWYRSIHRDCPAPPLIPW